MQSDFFVSFFASHSTGTEFGDDIISAQGKDGSTPKVTPADIPAFKKAIKSKLNSQGKIVKGIAILSIIPMPIEGATNVSLLESRRGEA